MEINKYLSQNKINEALECCLTENLNYLGILISKIQLSSSGKDEIQDIYKKFLNRINESQEDIYFTEKEKVHLHSESLTESSQIRVLLACNWLSNKDICDLWNKMSKNSDYSWGRIKIVWEEPYDYYCIINKPCDPNFKFIPEKTILFRMEPNMEENKYLWGEEWSKPDARKFKFVGYHENHLNNNEWHLSKTYTELLTEKVVKNEHLSRIISTVLSDKYYDPGHKKRIDFMKFVESKNDVKTHVFGSNKFVWKNYKGSLPPYKKDDSLFPYKYSFNVENFSIKNYYTEKLIDGILTETLVFYSGCPNVKEYIDERAFVYLELENFEKDHEIVQKAIREDWWSQRIEYIREAKRKILNELQFFPRLEKLIS
jgi:hypothetical protein